MQGPDRRQFLQAGVAAAALAASSATAAEGDAFPVVDTHQHLWDRKKFRLPWITAGSFLDRDYLPKDYAEAIRGTGIRTAVYLEVDVDPKQQQAEADYIAGLCKSGATPTRVAVISGRPGDDGFAAYIRPFKEHPSIRGVRRVLHGGETPAGHCLEKNFVRGVRLLGELGLHFELCMRPADLPDATKLVDACPDTRFVLDHCGNADLQRHEQWKKDIAELAKRKNVVGKVSGVVAQAERGKWKSDDLAPVVNHTLAVFGPDRVMFGSDWPVCLKGAALAEWLKALREIVAERKRDEQRKLFYANAVAFYRIPEAK
ncbi:MAG: amidohydrolase family protein [Gemmataceae bacterium]